MKKLALVLGSLLVVGTAASAKEVVPAPVVVPEKVVEVVEKPVIVYRDREVEQGWKPNGSFEALYTVYGETENKTAAEHDWARDRSNAGRLQTITNVNFTENQTLNLRTRNYHGLRSSMKGPGSYDEKDNWVSKAGNDELRLRHFYNFGTLGDSKVTAKSRLEYNQVANDGKKHLEASVAFDFSNYFFSNDYFKVTEFALRPLYRYTWSGHNTNDNEMNRYGLSLETGFAFPFGFELDLNVHGRHDRKDGSFRYDDGKKSDTWAEIEAILSNSTNLYKAGNFGIDFAFEGGYDTYNVHKNKVVERKNGKNGERRSYSLYAQPSLVATYKPTEFVALTAQAGAEYRNWNVEKESAAKLWRWQPFVAAGVKVSF
ncbi:major outer membrane protein FomA [Fusobacterium gastrosuis]|uniref:major outer membrane protein FomA n=1 Tax=Fusobacterium gastrosuis TaxID=1755100 RepID=UPI002A97A570|nr:hypothetical protein [Fusobacterium gastrosuis]